MFDRVLLPLRGSVLGLMVLALLAAAVFNALAFDQGQMLSLVQGDAAYARNFIHAVVHDARHVAGFPCH
jgi:hypothetical protein